MIVRTLQLLRRSAVPLFAALVATSFVAAQPKPSTNPEAVFAAPPESAKPWVFWYWMKGTISREGITADLEAFARVGLGGVYLVPIQDVPNLPLFEPSVRTLTPEWWEMLRHTFREAARLKLKIAMHASDGFATAGGPWITPELAMQKVVWTEQQVEGGAALEVKLPQPASHEGFYRDIAILAFPARDGEGLSSRNVVPKVTTDVAGADAQALVKPGNTKRLRSENPCWVQFEFAAPFTCRSIVVRPDGANYPPLRMIVEVGDDGKTFRSLGRLKTPRHGWQDGDAPYTFSIPTTTARFFRFVHDPSGAEPFAEDLDSAKWKHVFKVQGIELFSDARVPHYEGKSGAVWRSSERADSALIPGELCVPQDKIIDLTSSFGTDGTLKWQAPPGRWTILRVGHTATGHRNETAGAGRGLECDKFNPEAARLQFDKWFGETIRQVGTELAGKVLKIFHVDSWEAGSQNWSATFREEFKRRRGYDLTPFLPLFAGIPVESAEKSEQVLNDIRLTISDLTIDGFFVPLAELAKQHGCIFTAETTAPTMMGEGMRHFDNVDVPMGEFWFRSAVQDKPNDIHDAISGARVYGKNVVMSEAFTQRNLEWDEHPGMLKALGDHNFALGVNKFLIHVAALNPWSHNRGPGMTLSNIGLFYGREQTWFEQSKAWITYLSRCSAMLQLGQSVVDVAYFAGEELPARAILPERRKPELPRGFQADTINRDALLKYTFVRNGRIELPGGASYAVLVVQDTTKLSPEVAKKIDGLRRAGAAIFDQARERQDLRQVLRERLVQPDLLVRGKGSEGIEWTHRKNEEADIYFVSNQSAATAQVELSVNVRGLQPEWYDPVTGVIQEQPLNDTTDERGEFAVELPAHGSAFVVLRRRAYAASMPHAQPLRATEPLVTIEGTWGVSFKTKYASYDRRFEFDKLTSWSEHGEGFVRYFSGTATYTKTFEWTNAHLGRRIWLDLGKVANLASVQLNGVDCGTAWTEPMRLDITRALRNGKNTLEIHVTNTWLNRLIGDAKLPPEKRTTYIPLAKPIESRPLLEAGLLGPVRLVAEPEVVANDSSAIRSADLRRVYEEAKTPYKYGVVIAAPPGKKVDCPNVFRHNGRWWMIYVQLENLPNGEPRGYSTQLAVSDDLLSWKSLGTILPQGPEGSWDYANAGGGLALVDPTWGGSYALGKHEGRYWMSYIGGSLTGYEKSPLSIGMASTNDPTNLIAWDKLPAPIMQPTDRDARFFENETLFKSSIIHDDASTLGAPFVMFYNARHARDNERIGIAISDDMKTWRRYGPAHIMDHPRPPGLRFATITGDPQVVRMGELWVMFFFGAFYRSGAFDTFAVSRDLVHWTPWTGPDLISSTEPYEKEFAHKPWVIKHDGVVYHFYCAVGSEGRVIALATSKDFRPTGSVLAPDPVPKP
ncbi:MAG: glycosyl hydrolase [Nibricoccus sp.]